MIAFPMAMQRNWSVRTLAGALLFCVCACVSPLSAQPIRIAAERPDALCPGPVLGIVRLETNALPADAAHCVAILTIPDLSQASLDAAAEKAGRLPPVAAAIVEVASAVEPSNPEWKTRFAYAAKKLSSAIRGASPQAQVGYDLTSGAPFGQRILLDLDLGPYIDAFVRRPERGAFEEGDVGTEWLLVGSSEEAASSVITGIGPELAAGRSVTLIGLVRGRGTPLQEADWRSLARLQSYWTADVSRDPTPTAARLWTPNPAAATGWDVTPISVLRLFDAKKLTPLLFLPSSPSPRVEIDLPAGTYSQASVENLETGARRDFALAGGKALTVSPRDGALAILLEPASRGGETKTTVEVGARQGLTAREIVARERAWDSAQRERTKSFIADMKASLRFRIAEVNETFDLTIRGPFYFHRGSPPDWEWDEFYLNGIKWKSKTLPKLPILQPEKVTTLPLDIRLTEDYDYALHGEATVAGRRTYRITFAPRTTAGDKPIYRGTVWIDKETFALLRRDSVQLNLRGETLLQRSDRALPAGSRASRRLPASGDQGRTGLFDRRPNDRDRTRRRHANGRLEPSGLRKEGCGRVRVCLPDDPRYRKGNALPGPRPDASGPTRRRGKDRKVEHLRRAGRLL